MADPEAEAVTAPRKTPRAITLRDAHNGWKTSAYAEKLGRVPVVLLTGLIFLNRADAERLRDWLSKWLEATKP